MHAIPISHSLPFSPSLCTLLSVLYALIYMCLCCLYVMSDLTLYPWPLCAANDDDKELDLVSVANWGGRVTRPSLDPLKLPVDKVIIAHTVTEGCDTRVSCTRP